MSIHQTPGPPGEKPGDPPSRAVTTWILVGLALVMLVGLELGEFLTGRAEAIDVAIALAISALVVSAVMTARASGIELERRHSESESYGRIVRAISRADTLETVVSAIVSELGGATEADHVAVGRLNPGGRTVDVTFVSMLPGTPNSRTSMSLNPEGESGALPRMVTVATRRDGLPGPADGHRGPGLRAVAATSGRGHARTPAPVPIELAELIAAGVRDAYGLHNTVAEPLRSGQTVVGAIVLSRRTGEIWPEADLRLLRRAGQEASAALNRVYSQQVAENEARTDPLTGLANRRYFDEYCKSLASGRRATDRVAIVSVDVDHFKRLNDLYGHQVGDTVLQAIATAIASTVRGDDVPVRFGGEEFVVLLRNPAEGVALDIGERMRQAVREMDLSEAGVHERVTISVGVAAAQHATETVADVVERADKALYAAKRAGRDRVVEAWHAHADS